MIFFNLLPSTCHPILHILPRCLNFLKHFCFCFFFCFCFCLFFFLFLRFISPKKFYDFGEYFKKHPHLWSCIFASFLSFSIFLNLGLNSSTLHRPFCGPTPLLFYHDEKKNLHAWNGSHKRMLLLSNHPKNPGQEYVIGHIEFAFS